MTSHIPCRHAHLLVLCALLYCPLQAQQASPGSSSSRSKLKSTPAAFDQGTLIDGYYRNRFFEITYKLPYGWVDRTDRMQNESEPGKSQVLLATFARPPEAAGDTINAAVVLAAESVSSYPGLKSAAEYAAHVSDLTVAKGFKPMGDPQEFLLGSRRLIRSDFKKDLAGLTMNQSTLVLLTKGYVVSFTFVGGSDEEVQNLITGLNFSGSTKTSPKP